MKANMYFAIAAFSVVTLCGIRTISAQSPRSRARMLDLRALDISGCADRVWSTGTTVNAQAWSGGISYSATSGAARLSWIAPPTDIGCGEGRGGAGTKKGLDAKVSGVTNDSSDACTNSYIVGYLAARNSQWQVALDTLKRFIETCPHNENAPRAISFLGDAMAHLDHGDSLFRDSYLRWLESVLYLNTTNSEYFCQCVQQIAGALPFPRDKTAGYVSRNTNMSLAVYRWLILNTTCDTPYLWQLYSQSRETQLSQWENNPNAYVLDTTLPPLSKWGLDTVLAKHFQYALVKGGSDNFSSIVPSYNVTQNPTDGATELRFTLGSDAYVNVEVHDVLGRLVSGDAIGKILSVGDHRVPIDISNYPAGTYYLSITLGTGEVRTVKLVKK